MCMFPETKVASHVYLLSERDKEKQDPVPPKLGIFSGWDWLMLNPVGAMF